MKRMVACLAVLMFAGVAGADVTFTAKPSVTPDGAGAKIAFAVSGATDVEVAIVDAKGIVVRHLAAGVLGGKNPPPAPLKAGLAQQLVWDGKDDFGKAAPSAGDLKVRVRAGTGVKFGRFIGDEPYVFGELASIAADEAGNVYIMGYNGNRNQHMRTIRAFDADGRYLRTVMPFPADLPGDAMKDVAAWDSEAKAFRPRNLTSLNPEFYGSGPLTLVSASSKAGLTLTDGGSVAQLDARGGVPGSAFVTQQLWGKDRNPNTGNGGIYLAASPDGKYIYLSGPYSSKTQYGHEFNAKFPPGCVYRAGVGAGNTMAPFVTIRGGSQGRRGRVRGPRPTSIRTTACARVRPTAWRSTPRATSTSATGRASGSRCSTRMARRSARSRSSARTRWRSTRRPARFTSCPATARATGNTRCGSPSSNHWQPATARLSPSTSSRSRRVDSRPWPWRRPTPRPWSTCPACRATW